MNSTDFSHLPSLSAFVAAHFRSEIANRLASAPPHFSTQHANSSNPISSGSNALGCINITSIEGFTVAILIPGKHLFTAAPPFPQRLHISASTQLLFRSSQYNQIGRPRCAPTIGAAHHIKTEK